MRRRRRRRPRRLATRCGRQSLLPQHGAAEHYRDVGTCSDVINASAGKYALLESARERETHTGCTLNADITARQVASKSTAGTLSNASKEATPNASSDALAALDLQGANGAEEISDRTVTGVLTSHPQSRDVHIESVTLLFHGHQLLEDTAVELNHGR